MNDGTRRRVFIIALFVVSFAVGALVILIGLHNGFGVTMPGASYP
jgi:hypothetical protein